MTVSGTEAAIVDALLWFAGQIVTDPPLPVAQPGVKFKPPTNGAYLGVNVLPNTAERFGVGFNADTDYQGVAQVSVFWASGSGIVKPTQVAAQVVAAFAPGTTIDRNGVRVRIDRQPAVAPALIESDRVQIPVTIRWRAFVPAAA